jgi:acyl-CoA thioester hydrolase
MTSRADFSLLHRLRVRFVEVDRQGILHNSHYLVYFGIALNEYYRVLGFDRIAAGETSGSALHVVSAAVEYRAPLFFDEEVDIGVRIARLGRSSATFAYAIFKADAHLAAATGQQVWVNTDIATNKGTAWPEVFVALVAAREGERLER